MVPLDHLAVIEANGADAVDFLQGQLTQDVKKLGDADAQLAGYCTAKGRMLASAVIWRPRVADGEVPRVLAMVDASLAESLRKRLSMYVLRAKVTLSVAPLRVAGVWGGGDASALHAVEGTPSAEAWSRTELPNGTWIAAPSAQGGPRWWWIGSAEQMQQLGEVLPSSADVDLIHAWRAADIVAGLPWIVSATQDLFVPQMINFELVGGVSFTKGCYPGQEVVARSHYLGKLKRRMFAGRLAQAADADALVGADIFQEGEEQPCGRIVNAARDGGGLAVLYECSLGAAGGPAPLHAGSPTGPAIVAVPLPYALPESTSPA